MNDYPGSKTLLRMGQGSLIIETKLGHQREGKVGRIWCSSRGTGCLVSDFISVAVTNSLARSNVRGREFYLASCHTFIVLGEIRAET